MFETPSPYYDAAKLVGTLGRELEDSCPKAGVVLLALASAMTLADFDTWAIDELTTASRSVAGMLMLICEQYRQELHEVAESN